MVTVKLSKIIAPTFAGVHRDIKQHQHTHYWLKGGRGSTKSSFISVEIPLGMMRRRRSHQGQVHQVCGGLGEIPLV